MRSARRRAMVAPWFAVTHSSSKQTAHGWDGSLSSGGTMRPDPTASTINSRTRSSAAVAPLGGVMRWQ
uniref:Uncharacterized protein n=1 Tax=Human herpesvirus 2 TaxID=10310 RepID=A0A481TES7_HHV2|nr:hypothetical protein [Human alphaherpesvirus 2]